MQRIERELLKKRPFGADWLRIGSINMKTIKGLYRTSIFYNFHMASQFYTRPPHLDLECKVITNFVQERFVKLSRRIRNCSKLPPLRSLQFMCGGWWDFAHQHYAHVPHLFTDKDWYYRDCLHDFSVIPILTLW